MIFQNYLTNTGGYGWVACDGEQGTNGVTFIQIS